MFELFLQIAKVESHGKSGIVVQYSTCTSLHLIDAVGAVERAIEPV